MPSWDLFIGWGLGVLNTLGVDWYRRHREDSETRKAIRNELWELRYRMAAVVFTIRSNLGTIDRATLEWLHPIVLNYNGLYASDHLAANIGKILTKTDPEIAALAQKDKSPPEMGMALKKYAAPLLDSKFTLVSTFPIALQTRLLEVRALLNMYNEEVDQARFYFRMTFDKHENEGNYDRAVANLVSTHKHAANTAQRIVDHIGKIVW